MSYVERHTVAITVDGSGDSIDYTPVVTGKIVSITYTKTDFANGVDFVVTGEVSGVPIWTGTNVNATATVAPRQATHDTSGAAALYVAAGTAVNDDIVVANERIKIVTDEGGVSKSGTMHIYVQ